MFALLVQGITLYVVSWTLWQILRRFIIKTDLDNIPGPPSASLLKGNFQEVFNPNAWAFHKELAEHYGRVVRIDALLGDKQVYVFDPTAVYHIVVKDQHIYEETAGFIAGNRLFFGEGLLSTLGERHRKQRKLLAPVFSISHMRNMISIFYDVAHKLRAGIASKVADGPQEVDMLKWMARTALELIGQSGLGHSFDTLADNSDVHPYSVSVKQLIPTAFHLFFIRSYVLSTLMKIGTPRFRRFVVDMMPFWKRVRQLRDITDVIHNTSVEIFEEKKRALKGGTAALSSGVRSGEDIMSIMMKANMEAPPEDRLPDVDVLGQISTLTFAAMDTTSGALSRVLHLLATHPEVQEKLRQELLSAQEEAGNPNLPYDELSTLPFLDAVCRETLRMYPPFPNILRTTRQDVIMPLTLPIKGVDGREMAEVVIPKNTNVIISVLNCNRDPMLWGPDSHEWKPERWMKPLPQALTDAHVPGIYSHLLTFLGGGRACIGFKFSQLEMKVVLSVLLSSFRFSLTEKEIFWEMSGILTPTIKGRSRDPRLPLQVSLV